MADDFKATAEKNMSALETWLAPIFAKAPHLPQNIRDTLVTIAPWLALIFGILGLLGVLSAFSMLSMFSNMPFLPVMSGSWYPPMVLALICSGIASLLELVAFKPLSSKKKRGWNLLFAATILTALSTLISAFFGYASIGGILGFLIGLWLLFEVRGSYR